VRAVAAAVAIAIAAPMPALAAPNPVRDWFDRMQTRLDELLAEARPPLVPPTPVAVSWSMQRLGEFGPEAVLELAALDVDGDGADELLALGADRLRVFRVAASGLSQATELPLGGPVSTVQPRLGVGALVAGDTRVVVRSSARAWAQSFDVTDGRLVAREASGAGFPLCADLAGRLVPGRHYFDGASARWNSPAAGPPLPARFFAARCHRGVDSTGAARVSLAVVDTDGLLSVYDLGKPDAIPVYVEQVGYAFAVADIDNDGRTDIVASGSAAPGAPDRVSVYELSGGEVLRLFASPPLDAGVVAAAVGDFDGDGRADAVVALRPHGGGPLELWSLN